MTHSYRLSDVDSIPTPALVWHRDAIDRNIAWAVSKVSDPARLRPHCKTHKCAQIIKLQLQAGVTKHKCSTIAEAEMLAQTGVHDVLLSYPLVGPNIDRFVKLMERYPKTCFAALVDHPDGFKELQRRDCPLSVYLDLDVGMKRTGIPIGDSALSLAESIQATPNLTLAGLHAYDGHSRQTSLEERRTACNVILNDVVDFRSKLDDKLPIVMGGTPSFPVYAERQDVPYLECSPGTYVLHDHGYRSRFPDFAALTPAAILVTRLVSRSSPTRITFDLGNKAVASDPLLENRVHFLDIADVTIVIHSEEHLVIETPDAERWSIGDVAYAIPGHVCPTSALYNEALIALDGKIVDTWPIEARDRRLTF